MSEKEDVIEGPGFTIIDRRIGAKKSEDASPHEAEKKDSSDAKQKAQRHETRENEKPEEETSHEIPLPEVDFPAFIMSLCTSVLIHLGDIPDPTTNQKDIDLPLAKQTIDIISMLKEKTEGNRTKDEDQLVEEMLYNMRMKYLALSNKNPKDG